MSIQLITTSQECCGCNACGDICPVGAISFLVDREGFLQPSIDANKCIECRRCLSVCPIHMVEELKNRQEKFEPMTVAAVAKDLEVRFDSTSGGVFTVLAEKVFAQGGYVGGAVWGEQFEIRQIVSNNVNDLPRLRSSKYAQSDARGFYVAVKKAVDSGKTVLICGTPCQMVAMRTYLGRDYDNLIIVDFICLGINSPLVMRRYIEMAERRQGKRVVAIKQKCKELGWNRLTTKFVYEDGSVWYDPKESSLFMRGYLLGHVFCRPSCYECRFKGFPRLADLTIADCWSAVEQLKGNLNNNLGTSLVMCNTLKGQSFFEGVKDCIELSEINWDEVQKGNLALTSSITKPKIDRELFYSQLRNGKFEEAMSFLNTQVPKLHRSSVRRFLSGIKRLVTKGFYVFALIRINGIGKVASGKALLYPKGRVVVDIAANARMEVLADTWIGTTVYRKPSSLESRLKLMNNAVFRSFGYSLGYGCDIEVFENALLEIGPEGYSNIGLTIICGTHIKLGRGVICGRNVTIRDTNGEHYLNRPGYKCSKPVEIGDHVWLCEDCHILPGVKIGSGSVVAAGAIVTKNVPENTLVAGNPAKVIRTNVQWR